jgi:hypothetical protein
VGLPACKKSRVNPLRQVSGARPTAAPDIVLSQRQDRSGDY